jgi:hypothetical protein
LYVVTRADLPAGLQAVQSVHAALDYAAAFPDYRHETVIVLAAPDEFALAWLIEHARRAELAAIPFHEADLDGALTAVALEPAASGLCSSYPLALREPAVPP